MQRLSLTLNPGKKAYFASDFHLGAPNYAASLEREKKLVRWLDSISTDCQYLFLLGDLFDFWFDYHDVVPKGFVRLLGKLATMADGGIEISLFTGNHDMWMFGYLKQELGVKIFRKPLDIQWNKQSMQIGHGDGLGPGDNSYKLLKRIFENRLCQWLFSIVHPRVGIGIANAWSSHSRVSNHTDQDFLGDKEFLWQYCNKEEAKQHRDFFIFGHRHLPLDLPVGNTSRYINLGEWLNHCLYAEYDGGQLVVKTWE